MSKHLGQPVVVMNKPGASTIVASQLVARAAPDGYTLILASYNHAINPHLFKDLPFDPIKDFSAIGKVADIPFVLTVNSKLPVYNVKELKKYLQENPGKFNYASTSNGTPPHVAGELFKKEAGLKVLHVPYAGSSAAMTALLGGQVTFLFVNTASGLPLIQSGQLRALAAATPYRISELPKVPTMEELGYDDFNVSIWCGLLAPAHTPPDVIQRLNDALKKTLASKQLQRSFAAQGAKVTYSTASEFSTFIGAEIDRLGALVKDLGIHIQ